MTQGGSARHPVHQSISPSGASMIRIFLFVTALGAVLLVGGMVYLGMFPPTPAPHAVERVVPNGKFAAH
jgi:hypothetical protein